jgi:hypothetical protein
MRVNGFEPIAGRHEQHATIWSRIWRGIALRCASPFRHCDFSGPVLKTQLLELCARIGFTPPAFSKLDDVFFSFDVLEVSCRNNSPS